MTQHKQNSNTLDVVEVANGRSIYTYTIPFGYSNILFMPDGRRLLHDQKRVEYDPEYNLLHLSVADLASSKIVGELKTGQFDRPSAIFSPDGKCVLTVDAARIKVWDVAGSTVVSTLEVADGDNQIALIWLPGTRMIRGADRQGIIQSWDADTGKRLSRVEPQDLTTVRGSASFTSDGKTLLVGGDGAIELRDAQTARLVGVWRHGPKDRSTAYLDTLRGDTVIVNIDGTRAGDLAVARLPALRDLTSPSAARNIGQALPKATAPATAPAISVPEATDGDLRTPRWWLEPGRGGMQCPWRMRGFGGNWSSRCSIVGPRRTMTLASSD